jgi:alpha-amylase/alpha-mannosidase (GH57 family)
MMVLWNTTLKNHETNFTITDLDQCVSWKLNMISKVLRDFERYVEGAAVG